MSTNQAENFTGKVAFVTGAGTGIGRATALAFAGAGARVVAADVSTEHSQETARLITEAGGRPWPLPATCCAPPTFRRRYTRLLNSLAASTTPSIMPVWSRKRCPWTLLKKKSGSEFSIRTCAAYFYV